MKENNFTEGPILGPLIRFAFPVMLALVLQAMYGAVDLLVVGKFGASADVSAVSTGSQLMQMITNMVAGFSMGTTILLGQQIGQGRGKDAGRTIGTSLVLFLIIGILFTMLLGFGGLFFAEILHAPAEAMQKTANYIRICGAGSLIIVSYNLIGSIFRGLGDSKTPLMTVAIACVINVFADILFVAGLQMGTEGAACATVLAQLVSVIISFLIIRKKDLGFSIAKENIRLEGRLSRRILVLGIPVALQELLVGISFLVIAAIVNSLGLVASAGIGVAEKICVFIMLIPSAFMQSLAAFVSQNYGAMKYDRVYRTLFTAVGLSVIAGVCMWYLSYFHGTLLASIFSNDIEVVHAGADYLRAYAIDCLFTAFLFCFVGFYNGIGKTRFVMLQGICGAFLVRVPLSFVFSKMEPVSLFRIGLATPCSTVVQILLCVGFLLLFVRKELRAEAHTEKGNETVR